MRKQIKYLLTGFVSISILFVLAITAIPYFIDQNILRSQITTAVQEATGQELTIHGEIEWSIFPHLQIEAHQVTLNNSKNHPFFTIDKINMSVAIWPLITSKKIVLDLNSLTIDTFGAHATGALHIQNNPEAPFAAEGHFEIDQLTLNQLKMTEIDLPLVIKNDVYSIKPITAQLYGGNFSGDVILNLSDNIPQWKFDYQLDNMQIQTLGNTRLTSGIAQSSGQLSAAGFKTNELLQSLMGAIQIQLADGTLQGVDFDYWWQVGHQLLTTNPHLAELTNTKRTEIKQLDATFKFNHGIGKTDQFILYNDVLYIRGTGQINLINQTVHMTFYVSENKNGQPFGTAIPLIVSGPLDDISVKPDEKTIAAMAAKVLSSEAAKAATRAIEKNIPEQIQQPLNDAIHKLLGL